MTSVWCGKLVRLRGIEPEDWQAFQRFDEHSAHMRDVDRIHPPRSAAGYRAWAAERSVAESGARPDEVQLAIESLAGGLPVGSLSTMDTDPHAGRFSYGIGIGAEHQRLGYASEAITILLRYFFDERRYHKCEIGVHAGNTASLALHESSASWWKAGCATTSSTRAGTTTWS